MHYDPTSGRSVQRNFDKMYNAYMLFYERVHPQKVSNIRLDPAQEAAKVPSPLFHSIWDENRAFLFDKNIFDSDYNSFVWQSISSTARAEAEVEYHIRRLYLFTYDSASRISPAC